MADTSWEMQVRVYSIAEKKDKWVSVQCSGSEDPYRYHSQMEAQQMLDSCYSSVVSENLRVIQVPHPANIGKGVKR